jgi:putative tryptophan/tyrosine transport system substrate-binding protein
MRRREFIRLVGGAAALPLAARAQHSAPLIGFLSSRSPEDSKPHLAGFLRGLEAFGYVDGKTATIEYRWAKGQYDQLPKLASELANLHPTIIAAPGGMPSARAAKLATNTIPIFFVTSDSVQEGLVASLNQPGGNITGVDIMSGELTGKRLELLARLVSSGRTVAFLTNSSGRQSSSRTKDFEGAARSLNHTFIVVDASNDAELDSIFSKLAENKVGGVVVENDPFFSAALNPGDLSYSRISCRWRINELRSQSGGRLLSNGHSSRAISEGCERCRSASRSTHQVRTNPQSHHGESAWP